MRPLFQDFILDATTLCRLSHWFGRGRGYVNTVRYDSVKSLLFLENTSSAKYADIHCHMLIYMLTYIYITKSKGLIAMCLVSETA